jgi:hypothetical protein
MEESNHNPGSSNGKNQAGDEDLHRHRCVRTVDAGQALEGVGRGQPVGPGTVSIGGPWRSDRDNRPALEQISPENLVFNPIHISRTPKVVEVLPAREIDLSGRLTLHTGKGNVGSGPSEVVDFFNGALISKGGRAIFALTSRNREGKPNVLISVRKRPNQFSLWESVITVVTEYGSVNMKGRSVRERAQLLIDIAHPDDRADLVAEAKRRNILYPDQIFLSESAHLYPTEIQFRQTFRGDTALRFRALKPSDEENMRQLSYQNHVSL